MALCGRARGADGSRKEAKTQRKPRTGLCDARCGAPFFATPIHIPTGREATGGLRWANTHRLRSVNRLSSTCVMLSRAERWVSRSVVNCADARGGIWDVELVEEIRGRPLHHTLLNIESQQAVLSVVQCPSLLHPPPTPAQAGEAVGRGNYGCRFDGIGRKPPGVSLQAVRRKPPGVSLQAVRRKPPGISLQAVRRKPPGVWLTRLNCIYWSIDLAPDLTEPLARHRFY